MKQIPKNKNLEHMQLHIDNAFNLINEFLPYNYVDLVIEKFPKNKAPTTNIIHNLRRRKVSGKKHLILLNIMVEIAQDYKKEEQKLIELTT